MGKPNPSKATQINLRLTDDAWEVLDALKWLHRSSPQELLAHIVEKHLAAEAEHPLVQQMREIRRQQEAIERGKVSQLRSERLSSKTPPRAGLPDAER